MKNWLPLITIAFLGLCEVVHSQEGVGTPDAASGSPNATSESALVHVRPVINKGEAWDSGTLELMQGSIRQFNAEALVLVDEGGKQVKLASDRIVRVEFSWQLPEIQAALRLVEERKHREAITALETVLKQGVKRWEGRFLLAEMVRSADALGSTSAAGTLFLQYLVPSAPPPMLYADMPLCWTTREPSATTRAKATQWLASDDEHSQLLGASWLLLEGGAEPREKLNRLKASANQTVAQLAAAQLWRLVPPTETVARLDEWMQFREQMLEPIQIGPTEFLADRLMRIGSVDLSIGEWLRIATVHRDRYHRAELALKVATELMIREGRQEDAEKVQAWKEELSQP